MRPVYLVLCTVLAIAHAEDQPAETEAQKEANRLADIQLKQEDIRLTALAIIAIHRKYHTFKADKGDPRPRMQRILSEIIELNKNHQGARNNARLDYLRGEAQEIIDNMGKEKQHMLEILDSYRSEQMSLARFLNQLAALNGKLNKDDHATLRHARAVMDDFDTAPKPEELGLALLAAIPVAKRVVILKEGKPIEVASLLDFGGEEVLAKGMDGKQVKIPRENIKEIVVARPKKGNLDAEKSTEQAKAPEK